MEAVVRSLSLSVWWEVESRDGQLTGALSLARWAGWIEVAKGWRECWAADEKEEERGLPRSRHSPEDEGRGSEAKRFAEEED